MRIYLATWLLEVSQGEVLTKVGGNRRLLSYHLNKEKTNELPHYFHTGLNENLPSRQRLDNNSRLDRKVR